MKRFASGKAVKTPNKPIATKISPKTSTNKSATLSAEISGKPAIQSKQIKRKLQYNTPKTTISAEVISQGSEAKKSPRKRKRSRSSKSAKQNGETENKIARVETAATGNADKKTQGSNDAASEEEKKEKKRERLRLRRQKQRQRKRLQKLADSGSNTQKSPGQKKSQKQKKGGKGKGKKSE